MSELLTNGLQVTSNASYGTGDTSIAVTYASGGTGSIPTLTGGQIMRCYWDGEIIQITAVSGIGNVNWTITRATENTSAVSHGTGSSIMQILTLGGLQTFVQTTELVTRTVPTLSQFTSFATSATVVDSSTGIAVTGAANTATTYIRSAGLTAPWNLEIGILGVVGPQDFGGFSLAMRAGSAGVFIDMSVQHSTTMTLNIQTFNSSRVFSANIFSKNLVEMFPQTGAIYLRVQDDGTNRTYFISPDLLIWLQIYTETRATLGVIDRGGFGAGGSTSYGPCVRIIHYREY